MLDTRPKRHAARRHQGEAVERLVADWFERLGYDILDRNFANRLGELDLVMQVPGRVTVFVEVRYRRSTRFGGPLETIDARKRQRLRQSAAIWATRHDRWHQPLRLDVVGATPLKTLSDGRPRAERPVRVADGSYSGAFRDLALDWVPNAIEL